MMLAASDRSAIDPAAPLVGLAKMKLGADEWKHLVNPEPGTTFNLSTDEIARFRALGGGASEAQVEGLLRQVLAQRITRYAKLGLGGLTTYAPVFVPRCAVSSRNGPAAGPPGFSSGANAIATRESKSSCCVSTP